VGSEFREISLEIEGARFRDISLEIVGTQFRDISLEFRVGLRVGLEAQI
jgi:hypothetical protein